MASDETESPWWEPRQLASLLQNLLGAEQIEANVDASRTPYEVSLRDPVFRLRHYSARRRTGKKNPAIVLVPPLMLSADVYDIAPEGSAVVSLLEQGIDPWVVDFGAPERQEGGLKRTLTDHVVAVSRAIDRASKEVGGSVHLGGYSQGGMFAYLAAAYRRSAGLASLVTFGSPVDIHRQLLPGVPDAVTTAILERLGGLLSEPISRNSLPPWASRTGFKLMSPVKELRSRMEFLTSLGNREAGLKREGQRRFLQQEGWVAWPGPALSDFIDQLLVENRLFSGGFVVEGRTVTLADVICPVLAFIGTTDDIARPAGVRALREAAPRAEAYEVSLKVGHFGLVVGSKAMRDTWPVVAAWLRWRDGLGKAPPAVSPMKEARRGQRESDVPRSVARFVLGLGRDALGLVGGLVEDGVEATRILARNAVNQLPRLVRLEGVRRDTRIGLGLALADQTRKDPDGTFFLYEGRAYTYGDANRRVEAVVRGLLSIEVRQGDHVGIFMDSRPTALALTAAVNRLGAVAVLLRPDGDPEREIALGVVEHVITDPEHAAAARRAWTGKLYVLGGVGKRGKLPARVIDMEQIDPDRVTVPEWYDPSPARAEDVAFVLFSGRGDSLRANRITNRRWALAAFGTASAAAMTSTDTVYCWTPIHHPTGLLVSISAALAAGARLALANGFTAQTFWEEVRRYGATVVFYTGTMCRELVDAPRDPAERNHPLRLFAGSGMPLPLWQRVVERFGPVGVLEFYASTEGNAILANISGEKIDSVGRPIPGSAEVALAMYDPRRRALMRDDSGFCSRVGDGESGLLLARIERERGSLAGKPLRSVFETADAWHPTGDLFTRDDDGDYWLVDHVDDLIHGPHGAIPSIRIEEAVWQIEAVSMAAAYGVRIPGVSFEVPVVTVVLRSGARLDPARLLEQVESQLEPESVPLIVRTALQLPMTAGYRARKGPLREAGIGPVDFTGESFWYDASAGVYRRLDAAAYARLCRTLVATERKKTTRTTQRSRTTKRKR